MITAKNRKAEILKAYEDLLAENLLLKVKEKELQAAIANKRGTTALTRFDYEADVKRRTEEHWTEYKLFVKDCGKAVNWITTHVKRVELPHWI